MRLVYMLKAVIPHSSECGPRGSRLTGLFYLVCVVNRVICLVDGFNLYHSLKRMKMPWLKWLDLWALSAALCRSKSEKLVAVRYYSAYAHWLPNAQRKHIEYVKALEARGVTPVMGQFKNKSRRCNKCGATWTAHEEKETDVNIALDLYRLAASNQFDRCLLISRDSDLAPSVRAVKQDFPQKVITTVSPPCEHRRRSACIDPRRLARECSRSRRACRYPPAPRSASRHRGATERGRRKDTDGAATRFQVGL